MAALKDVEWHDLRRTCGCRLKGFGLLRTGIRTVWPPVPRSSRVPLLARSKKTRIFGGFGEATPGIEPGCADLQSAASPLRHVAPRREHVSCAVSAWQWRLG